MTISYADRAATLADAKAKMAALKNEKLAALNTERDALHAAFDAENKALEEAHARELKAADEAFAVKLAPALEEITTKFPEAPRAVAAKLAEHFRAANADAIRQLDTPISSHHLTWAFGAAQGVEDRLYNTDYSGAWKAPLAAAGLAKVILGGGLPVEVEGAASALELAIAHDARNARFGDVGLVTELRSRTTDAGIQAARTAEEERRAAEKQAAFVAEYATRTSEKDFTHSARAKVQRFIAGE